MTYDILYSQADELEEIATALRIRAEQDYDEWEEERSRLNTLVEEYKKEAHRLSELVGGELLSGDKTTTRAEALQEVSSLKWKLQQAEAEITGLQSTVAQLTGNLVKMLEERLTPDRGPTEINPYEPSPEPPPRGYDIFQDAWIYLARVNPGTDIDDWVWVSTEQSFAIARGWNVGKPWADRYDQTSTPLRHTPNW